MYADQPKKLNHAKKINTAGRTKQNGKLNKHLKYKKSTQDKINPALQQFAHFRDSLKKDGMSDNQIQKTESDFINKVVSLVIKNDEQHDKLDEDYEEMSVLQ